MAIDTAPPTVTLPRRVTDAHAINSLAITFSEPVQNFTIEDLQFTLTRNGATASEPLEGATLTSTDNQNWTWAISPP